MQPAPSVTIYQHWSMVFVLQFVPMYRTIFSILFVTVAMSVATHAMDLLIWLVSVVIQAMSIFQIPVFLHALMVLLLLLTLTYVDAMLRV